MKIWTAITAALMLFCVGAAQAQTSPGLVSPNQVVAGPSSGVSPGLPSGRALVGGDIPFLGTMATQNANNVDITGGGVTGMPAPTNASDVATKMYVDSVAAGLIIHSQATLATAAALPTNTYSNGTAGVGATLTATTNGALTVDGVLTTTSIRIVVKNEATIANCGGGSVAGCSNGIYVVTTVGDGSHPYVLTRATDANTPGASDPTKIGLGTFVFIISGTANGNTGWSVNSVVTTIGTSAINWVQFSGGSASGVTSLGGMSGILSCGTNVSCAGSTVSVSAAGSNGQVQANNSGALGGLTNTQLTALINPFTSSLSGGAPSSGGGTVKFLRADGSWAVPPGVIVPDAFCTVDRTGASDMGACINSAISAAKLCNNSTANAGVGRVYLEAGTYLITTPIVPKSCMMIYGDGPGATVLLTNSNTPFGPPAGQQLVHFQLRDLTFKDSGSHASATVMAFPSLQDARLTNLGFSGYSSGTLASFSTSLVTSFDDTNAPWHDSNIVFNQYTNWQGDGCGICIIEAGHYGSTPTASPPNSSNVPDQVVTENHFENISLSGCATKCLDFIKATDTEFFTNVYTQLLSNAVAVQIGDDNANFPGNNYVNSMRIQITISGGATGTTFFQFGDWTLGNIIDVEHDYAVGAFTPVNIQTSVTLADYIICGKNLYTALAAFPIGNNGACGSGGTYFRVGNGSFNIPIFGFGNDIDNGLYLVSAGAAAWSRNFRIDGHILSGSALGVPTLTSCGTASFNPLPSDTAGQILISGGPVTACTLTFGEAFANIPLCVFTPVGVQNPVFVSAESTSAVTINFTSTSSQRFSYICLASPGG